MLVHIKSTKNPTDGLSRCPDYIENIELSTNALVAQLVLRMLQFKTHVSLLETHTSPLEAHWSRIGVHVNETLDASLHSHFISALKMDSLVTEYCDNPS